MFRPTMAEMVRQRQESHEIRSKITAYQDAGKIPPIRTKWIEDYNARHPDNPMEMQDKASPNITEQNGKRHTENLISPKSPVPVR